MGGAAVADAQAALDEGSGSLAEFDHKAHGIVVERIVVVGGNFSGVIAIGRTFAIFFRSLQEFFLILRLALRLPEFDNGRDLFLGDIRSMKAVHTRRSRG